MLTLYKLLYCSSNPLSLLTIQVLYSQSNFVCHPFYLSCAEDLSGDFKYVWKKILCLSESLQTLLMPSSIKLKLDLILSGSCFRVLECWGCGTRRTSYLYLGTCDKKRLDSVKGWVKQKPSHWKSRNTKRKKLTGAGSDFTLLR